MLIGITMGDASGVGPEIILRAYAKNEIKGRFVVIGDYEILEYCKEVLKYEVPVRKVDNISDIADGYLNVYDMGILKKDELVIGKISKKSGYAAMKYV